MVISWVKKVLTSFMVSTSLFISIIAFYVATVLNIAYYKQVLMRLPLDSLSNILFFLSMPIVIFCVIYAVLNLLYFRWLIKLVSLAFILIGAPLTYFMLKFSIIIDHSMIQNLLETNSSESFALITLSLIFYIIFLGVIPSFFVLFVKIKSPTHFFRYSMARFVGVILPLLAIGLLAAFLYQHYAAFMRNNNKVVKYIMPSNYISAIYSEYRFMQYKNLPFLTLGDDAYIKPDLNEVKKTLFVVIVGETARSQNFSLNGYEKQTNPRLSTRNDLIAFSDTSSCGTYTAYSVPCMFSNMPRNRYDESISMRQENVLDILQKAQVDVTWYDNDGGCKGVCDRVNYENSTNKNIIANNTEQCNSDGTCYDEVLLNDLQNKLQTATDNTLVVLHTIGSHGPTYYQRYPERFKKFLPTCDTNAINECSTEALINTYDNTIAYTDYIIDQTISTLERHQDRFNVGMIYISDHGESLGENGVYLHSLPYAIAPEFQTKVPFIMWLSSGYRKQFKVDKQCLENNAKQREYSQDYLFHTLLSSFNVQTQVYQSQLDILNDCRINEKE